MQNNYFRTSDPFLSCQSVYQPLSLSTPHVFSALFPHFDSPSNWINLATKPFCLAHCTEGTRHLAPSPNQNTFSKRSSHNEPIVHHMTQLPHQGGAAKGKIVGQHSMPTTFVSLRQHSMPYMTVSHTAVLHARIVCHPYSLF